MSRYRKVFTRTFAEPWFRSLSPMRPSAQSLWLYLLTGPHTTMIPGLWCAGEAGLAESLGWPLEDFRSCWAELEGQGLVHADWKNRVIFIPRALDGNEPANPSVVEGWADTLAEVPHCDLKRQAIQHLLGRSQGSTHQAIIDLVALVSPELTGETPCTPLPQETPRLKDQTEVGRLSVSETLSTTPSNSVQAGPQSEVGRLPSGQTLHPSPHDSAQVGRLPVGGTVRTPPPVGSPKRGRTFIGWAKSPDPPPHTVSDTVSPHGVRH